MDIVHLAYHERLNRYWRRRKYQRINGASHGKRKLKILRLGGGAADAPRRHLWRIRRVPKLHWKMISPIKLLAKIRDAYVGMMICLANKMANTDINGGLFKSKKNIAKQREVSILVSSGEQVDSRLVLEIYNRLAASRQLY